MGFEAPNIKAIRGVVDWESLILWVPLVSVWF